MSSICLVLPSLNVGGMERVMIELARYFIDHRKFKVHLIVMTSYDFFYQPLSSIKIYKPNFNFRSGPRIINQVKTLFFVRRKIRDVSPDYVLSFGEMYNSFVILSSLGLKTKVFVSDRSKPDRSWGFFHNNLRRILYKKAYGIISQTNYSKEFLWGLLSHDNIKVIPNPISANLIKSINQEVKRDNVILSVGRLIETKRFDLLIRAYANISVSHNWKLWIVGDGPLLTQLTELTRRLNLENQVRLLGQQQDVSYFFNCSKLFAFTSVSEGFPNVLLEALAHGLPVISFDCVAGPSDIIENGINGFLIKEMNLEGLTNQLEQLITNDRLLSSLQKNTYDSVRKFDPELIGESYYNFITYEKKGK